MHERDGVLHAPAPDGAPMDGDEDVEALIEADDALRAVRDAVWARMHEDAAHDWAHLVRVARWTLRILAAEPALERVDPRLAVAAALLHDVVNVPKHEPGRHTASERSADVVRELLPGLGFAPDAVALAADAVRDHSYSRGAVPTSALGRALQDADRLEALGALGIHRCIATGVRAGAALVDPDDPWAERRPLDERRWSVDHFFTKLLRLAPTLLTATGRAQAERRTRLMRHWLAQLGDELGVPLPADR